MSWIKHVGMSWIKKTLTDENDRPSANRQGGFIALIAAITFAQMGSSDYVIYAFTGLAAALFAGTQVSKFSQKKHPEDEVI